MSSKKYVSISPFAGLGNQLFMMAAAYAYAKQNSRECIVYLPETRASIHSRYAYVSTVFSKFPTTDAAIDTRIARDGAYSPLEDVSDNHVHIQGYFHNLLYFDTYRSEFTDALDMPTLPAEENTYFVHVRRGDFLLKYAADPMNLYEMYLPAAIQFMQTQFPGARMLVFSDDMPWCKQQRVFEQNGAVYNDNSDEVQTLMRMAACKNGGICWNSTFSWWGAYLNNSPTSVFVIPDCRRSHAEEEVTLPRAHSIRIFLND